MSVEKECSKCGLRRKFRDIATMCMKGWVQVKIGVSAGNFSQKITLYSCPDNECKKYFKIRFDKLLQECLPDHDITRK